MYSKKKWINLHDKNYKKDNYKVNMVMDYFKKNNLAHYENWKEEYASYRIHVMFDKFLEEKIPTEEFIEILKEHKEYLETMHKYNKNREQDNRSGEETYGYQDMESIRSNLIYVSDRWNCQFRLRWLIDLTEQVIKKN